MTAHGNNKPWSPERVEKLKKLWADGKSGTEIAAILGGDLSRAAVIGKANRLGLKARTEPRNFQTHTRATQALRTPTAPPVRSSKQAGAANARRCRPPKPGPQNKPGAVFGNVSVLSAEETEKKRAIFEAQGKSLLARFDAPANDDAILLIDRRRFQCAWPVGLPDRPANQMCCGQPVAVGGSISTASYCSGHARIALSKQQPVRKVPSEPSPRRAA